MHRRVSALLFFPQKSEGPVIGAKAEGSFECTHKASLIEKKGARMSELKNDL